MSRRGALIVCFVFAAYLFHGLAAFPLSRDGDAYRTLLNRSLSPRPELTAGRLLDERWYASISAYGSR